MRAFALGFLLATPGLLLLAACGGDDETPSELGGGAVDDGPAVVAAGCPATSITGATPEGTAFEASSAVAASIQDGAAYTLYLGDFDLTLVSVSVIGNPEVPAGGIMWTVAVTIFNPAPEDVPRIEVGRVVEAGRPFGELTFTVVVQEGNQFSGASAGQRGTVTVAGVGDLSCGTIEYSDDEKSISGIFQAPTKAI